MGEKITVSVIKADIGGFVGHGAVHPETLEYAQEALAAEKGRLLVDFSVSSVGDDINLVLTHRRGVNDPAVHQLAWETFRGCTGVAKRLKLYGAGQDLLADAFSGNIRGLGPGIAEMEFEERPSEPLVIFMADKTEPGAWNLPLYRIFADPFNTPGLVIDPKMHSGFTFEIHDLREDRLIRLNCPEEAYDLLAFIGTPGRFVVSAVYSRGLGEIAAVATTQRLNLIAGRYVGKDDPSMIIRCQSGLPAVGEVLEAFSTPHLVGGWMRGSFVGPLMPCAVEQAHPTRYDGPPRVIALGYQLAEGELVGPRDMFADVAFDEARRLANEIAGYIRRQGPFEPHRLPAEDMEYTTMPQIMARLADRFVPVQRPAAQQAGV
ncbi:MAG: fructose-1,6-bisphosphate aldolase/phosphatase [Bacillota bacterium]|nr:fructose-1,6-bisphosphate aldolase/phosphatase [Bacillota bacterium]